jgi:hypothetical protein
MMALSSFAGRGRRHRPHAVDQLGLRPRMVRLFSFRRRPREPAPQAALRVIRQDPSLAGRQRAMRIGRLSAVFM